MSDWVKTGGIAALTLVIGVLGTLGVQNMNAPVKPEQKQEQPDLSRYVSIDVSEQLTAQVSDLEGKLATAEKERDNAKSELAKADIGKLRTELTSVKEALEKAPKKADLDAALSEATMAKDKVAELETKLTVAEKESKEATEALAKAKVGDLQKELQSAKDALAKAPKQTDLETAQEQAKTAAAKVTDLEKKLAAAPKQDDIKALQTKVTEAEGAKVIAEKALKAVPVNKHAMKDVVLLATDGKDIVAATKGGTVILLGEKATKSFAGFKAAPSVLAVGEGRVAAAFGKSYVVWNTEDSKVAASGNHTEEITSIGFTKAGLAINDETPKTALPAIPDGLKKEWGVDSKAAYAATSRRLAVISTEGVTIRSLPEWLK